MKSLCYGDPAAFNSEAFGNQEDHQQRSVWQPGGPPWLTVGLRGQHSNGLRWKLRIARARSAIVICMFATTDIILSGRLKGRPRWSTVWYAVQTPRARVGGAPSALKLNSRSACRAGVWAGTCCAGSAIAALPAIGRYLSCVWS